MLTGGCFCGQELQQCRPTAVRLDVERRQPYVVDVAEREPVPGERLHRRQLEDAPPAKQNTTSNLRDARQKAYDCSLVVGRVQAPLR